MRKLPGTLLVMGLLGASLAAGCRDTDPPAPVDLTTPPTDGGGGGDMTRVVMNTTIRDINGMKVADNALVSFSGVVNSPEVWIDRFSGGECRFNVWVTQVDQKPELGDGMRVTRSLSKVPTDAGTPSLSECTAAAMNDEAYKGMAALKLGDSVQITGSFQRSAAGFRQVVVNRGSDVSSSGPAMTKPQPVVVTPTLLKDSAAFLASQSAFVRLDNVKTADKGAKGQYSFTVAADGSADKAQMSTLFIRSFMIPADGTTLKSVTGVVVYDSTNSYNVRPRVTDDIVP